MRNLFILIAILSACTSPALAAGEDVRIKELQAIIAQKEAEAAKYRQSVAAERAKADSLQKEIAILRSQIGRIEAQIAANDAKIDVAETQIDAVQSNIGKTREEMSRKRETLGRMILFLEQKDRDQLVANLFKYESLSEFIQQFHDLANMENKIIDVIRGLKEQKAALEEDKQELDAYQQELEKLNEEAQLRKGQLAAVTGERARVLTATKGQEAAYQAQLNAIEKAKAALFNELRELELKVVSGGLYVVHYTATSLPGKVFRRPEDDTYVTQGYGWTAYAKRGAYGGAPHNGVDYSSGCGTPILAIGDGQIVANGTNDGWGNWVAIRHPPWDIVSLYGHMSSFAGKRVGDAVTQGMTIGYEGSTGKSTGCHVHLSLYRDFFTYIKPTNGQLNFNYFEGTLNPANHIAF
jgi:murein DD-endopeptidase MepM/ murein hydrolase activator NlpD